MRPARSVPSGFADLDLGPGSSGRGAWRSGRCRRIRPSRARSRIGVHRHLRRTPDAEEGDVGFRDADGRPERREVLEHRHRTSRPQHFAGFDGALRDDPGRGGGRRSPSGVKSGAAPTRRAASARFRVASAPVSSCSGLASRSTRRARPFVLDAGRFEIGPPLRRERRAAGRNPPGPAIAPAPPGSPCRRGLPRRAPPSSAETSTSARGSSRPEISRTSVREPATTGATATTVRRVGGLRAGLLRSETALLAAAGGAEHGEEPRDGEKSRRGPGGGRAAPEAMDGCFLDHGGNHRFSSASFSVPAASRSRGTGGAWREHRR